MQSDIQARITIVHDKRICDSRLCLLADKFAVSRIFSNREQESFETSSFIRDVYKIHKIYDASFVYIFVVNFNCLDYICDFSNDELLIVD